jgi:hypothetical protein
MTEPRVVVRKEERGAKRVRPWDEGVVYRVVGWVGLVFVLVTLGDLALAFYPLGFGSPEWEVATVASVVQGFPLLTLGLVGVWVCAGGLGSRRLLVVAGAAFLVVAVALLLAMLLFLTNVPVALRGTETSEPARLGVLKLMAKTAYLAAVFGVSYVVAGILAVRRALGGSSQ